MCTEEEKLFQKNLELKLKPNLTSWETEGNDPIHRFICKNFENLVVVPQLYFTAQKIIHHANTDPGHIVITGNPGTGKRTGAKVLAKILSQLNIIESDCVIDACWIDVIDNPYKNSEIKTNELIECARGGVIIFNEVYLLGNHNNDSAESPRLRAVRSLIEAMTREHAPVFIFVGYKDKMLTFLNQQPTLRKLIKYEINLDDYTASQLEKVVMKNISKNSSSFKMETVLNIEQYFEALPLSYRRKFNAIAAEKLLEYAKESARRRTLEFHFLNRGGEITLTEKDLDFAVKQMKEDNYIYEASSV